MAESDENISGPYSKDRNCKRLRTPSSMREIKNGTLPSYFQAEYKDAILNALEAVETDVLLGRPIHWHMLIRVVRAMDYKNSTMRNCLKVVNEVFGIFERYQCRDLVVISEVLLVIFFVSNFKFYYTSECTKVSKFLCLPYGSGKTYHDSVWEAVTAGNLRLLKVLLKLGMVIMTPYRAVNCCIEHANYLLHIRCRICGDVVAENTEIILQEKIIRIMNSGPWKRLLLVLRVMIIVCKILFKPNSSDHFIQCYRMLFDSIPEAYLTSIEVKAYLEKCLPSTCSKLIFKLTEAFESLLPKLAEVPQPRSLKHLCRIQVRQSLRENLNLLDGASSLQLPTILKEYIILDDDSDLSDAIRTFKEIYKKGFVTLQPYLYYDLSNVNDCIMSFLKQL